ncbi:acetyl-CoA carboxylase biotin carboxyl carrier protein [Roseinatronobacter alkalisoli]|uniref:Biotin carboxyl carrier protein of acetyl-CoA carboxylase n=1 Tax=Roseinatronobacter alkalisoli TaxID=3028235 RepID=A0ABT5T519_9RHOB|nr:acetyl-CoA carboxylase biotin carboxyl carrier protein [Roseinatronobacter sp. HJB301]MDD7970086.1 acetyl-CoA carboxylase biotin carboxyl carrier protein [Roseinatronobacter sp. HJB301]
MNQTRNDADVAFIKALAELLNDNELSELSVKREYGENDSLNVRVSKMTAQQFVAAPAPQYQQMAAPAAMPQAPAAAEAPANADPAQQPGAVTSPMVGTAYLAPEPGSANFVNIGDQVNEGDTLLIIEAMKTMNHIPAPRAGIVKRIVVADGSPVEFGAPLMIIE